jgi:hypothetical protein
MSDPTMNHRDRLDDAIDRTVRDMTHVAADDNGVARVMARLRETDARDASDASNSKGVRWVFTPRVAWSSAAAILLMMLLSHYSWRPLNRDADGRHAAATTPSPSTAHSQPLAAREFPTPVTAAPSTVQATTAARVARGETVRPASVANGGADASDPAREEREAEPELAPLESDIVIASIMPAPLGDASTIEVAPLTTTALTVDEIPVASIDMPPVSPEQHK